MSTSILVFLSLLISSILCLFMNSWISIWVMLEVNTLSFCSILIMSMDSKKPDKEMMMKYLIIQSIASALLIMMMSISPLLWELLPLLLSGGVVALMTKAGASPFHQWFLEVSKKLKWSYAFILFSWQKLAPVFLLIFQIKKMIFLFLGLSAIFGSILMLNKNLLKEIFALSSVFNLSWIFLSIILSTKMFFQFLILYWMSLLFPIYFFYKERVNLLNQTSETSNSKFLLLLAMASLAGIPPLLGFLAKWMVLVVSLKTFMFYLTSSLLIISAVNFYIYLRIINSISISHSKKAQMFKMKTNSKMLLGSFVILNSVPIIIFTL